MKLAEYINLDGTRMAELVRDKQLTADELVSASFKQLEKVNDGLNAVTHTREETVFTEAEQINFDAPFAGVPTFLKDISQSIKGEIMTSGARLFQDARAPHTAYFTEKINQSGCLTLGHTTAPEFGLKNITESKLHGPTRNPWNTDYSPGGSSGGAAALVAAGVVPIAGASDGGGSIRIPAGFSGLVGLKPTRGRMPVGPGSGRQWHGASIDFILSRSVRDSATMLDTLQTVQEAAAFQTPLLEGRTTDIMEGDFKRPLKIGFTTESPVGTPVSADAKAAVIKTVKWLEAQGHIVDEVDNKIDGKQLMRDYFLMNSGEISALTYTLEQFIGRELTAEDVEVETWLLHVAGRNVSAAEFSLSLASWDRAAEKMAQFHTTYDFYVTPTNASQAPKIGELTHSKASEADLRERIQTVGKARQQELIYEMFLPSLTYTPFTQLANLTGQPAISLPLSLSTAGLPLGVQFMAAKGAEQALLKIARQLEQTNLWIDLPTKK